MLVPAPAYLNLVNNTAIRMQWVKFSHYLQESLPLTQAIAVNSGSYETFALHIVYSVIFFKDRKHAD